MRLDKLLNVLRRLAAERLAEDWDNVGLLLGDPAWPVRRAMLCIDLTEPVLEEAVAAKVNLIVAYHPPIFGPLKSVTTGDATQRIVLDAARRRIGLYSPHTALDAAEGGINDWLCDGLGAGTRRPIRPTSAAATVKLVTFVPPGDADRLRRALAAAGAGQIGDYSDCSFSVEGQGTFIGGAGTKPAVGERGRLEHVPEWRIEMVCPAARVSQVVAALRRAHPYEEPAFDLYPLQPPPDAADDATGQGRVVTLEKPIRLQTLVRRVKAHLGVGHLNVAAANGSMQIQRIGLCAGAGGALLDEAGPIEAFVTGEMRHHDVVAAVSRGVSVVLAGHTQTERPYLKVYRRRIIKAAGKQVDWLISKADRAPLRLK